MTAQRLNISSIISSKWDDNYNGSKGPKGDQPCLICGRGVNQTKAHWVYVDCRTGDVVEGLPTDHQEYGMEPIGPDCWRRFKSILQPFEQTA